MTMLQITKAAQMAEMIARLEQAGDTWHTPLIRAALRGEIAFTILSPGSRLPLRLLDPMRHPGPLVVVLGGDGIEAGGPGHFEQAARLIRWARFILLHGSGGDPTHYEIAVEAARHVRRVVIVETTADYLKDWVDFRFVHARTTPTLVVEARDGLHPVNTAPAGAVVQ
jgi:hypothetical protein